MNSIVKVGSVAHATDGVRFRGSLRMHPYDDDKILLITEERTKPSLFLEFRKQDILEFAGLQQLVDEKGAAMSRVDVYVRKGSVGLRMQPFHVE